MTGIDPIDWDARLRAAVQEALRKRATRRNQRQELNQRRQHGLTQRHATKTNRNPDTNPQASTDERNNQ